jgi:YVTN family beta-propeller protein
VANLDDRTLSRVDLKTLSVQRPISLRATPTGVAVGFGAVWVAHGLLGAVSRIAPQYIGIETIRPPFTRYSTTARGSIARGAGSIWVAFGDSSVSRIDPESRHILATLYAGNAPAAIAYGIHSVWVANAADSNLTRINPTTNLTTFGAPTGVGLSPSGIAVGNGAVWVTNAGSDNVSRVDPETNSVVTTIPVGRAPLGIAFGLGAVWVSNSGDGTVSRIDPVTNKVVATIRVGNSPRGIAVGAGYVWITVQAGAQAT